MAHKFTLLAYFAFYSKRMSLAKNTPFAQPDLPRQFRQPHSKEKNMKMHFRFGSMIIAGASSIAALSGCSSPVLDIALKNSVSFQYDHVANAHEIRFDTPLQVPGHHGINSVTPQTGGFWAVFVLCSLEVQGNAIQTFHYNITNFVVEYGSQSYGPLQPHTVKYGVSTSSNNAADTPKVAAAIANEVQLGPSAQTFLRGLYPSLNYRVAILIPHALQGYGGEPLTLRYTGQPSMVDGRGQRPTDVQVLGSSFGSAAGNCRPRIVN